MGVVSDRNKVSHPLPPFLIRAAGGQGSPHTAVKAAGSLKVLYGNLKPGIIMLIEPPLGGVHIYPPSPAPQVEVKDPLPSGL